jgi:hypothetical protein
VRGNFNHVVSGVGTRSRKVRQYHLIDRRLVCAVPVRAHMTEGRVPRFEITIARGQAEGNGMRVGSAEAHHAKAATAGRRRDGNNGVGCGKH